MRIAVLRDLGIWSGGGWGRGPAAGYQSDVSAGRVGSVDFCPLNPFDPTPALSRFDFGRSPLYPHPLHSSVY